MYEAMVTGPGSMPLFNDGVLTQEQKKDVITYLKTLEQYPDPGGTGLGRIGPVGEGLLTWTLVLGVLVAASIWLAATAR